MAPLVRIADGGCTVCVIPGNHERSRIPRSLLAWATQPPHLRRAGDLPGAGARPERGSVRFPPSHGRWTATFPPAATHRVDRCGRGPAAAVRAPGGGRRAGGGYPRIRCSAGAATSSPRLPCPLVSQRCSVATSTGPRYSAKIWTAHRCRHRWCSPDPPSGRRSRSWAEDKGYTLLRLRPGVDGGTLAGRRFVKLPTPVLPTPNPWARLAAGSAGQDQHGDLRQAGDPLGHRTQQQALQAGLAPGGEHESCRRERSRRSPRSSRRGRRW